MLVCPAIVPKIRLPTTRLRQIASRPARTSSHLQVLHSARGLHVSSEARTMASSAGSSRPPPTASSPIVMFGPSGTGKSTLLKRLQQEPEWQKFGFSVSHTTRKPRAGEENGVAYHFTTRDDFKSLVDQGAFIEHAEFGGNLYGTTAKAVEAVSKDAGKRCILDIDAQGVKLILENHPSLRPLIIFVAPPSLQALGQRLNGRGTETAESLKSRIGMAKSEISFAASGAPNVIIVNDDLDRAYETFKAVCLRDEWQGKGDKLPEGILDEDEGEVAVLATKKE